jgi:FkbM family methyltransferase
MGYLRRFKRVVGALGLRASVPYLLAERFQPWIYLRSGISGPGGYRIYRLHPPSAQYPVYCRRGSSDKNVFFQVFVEKEYGCLSDSCDPRIIVDCGANVGFSTVYFLSRFPRARVIAIEPDGRNVDMLRRNTAPYGERVAILQSAVWPKPAKLVVCKGTCGDGREWSTQVRECRDGEQGDLQAVDIGSLFGQFGFDQIDILKMDIEHAELAVFSENFEPWIGRVRIFLVELHNQQCKDAFFAALRDGQFEFSWSGELTVANRV